MARLPYMALALAARVVLAAYCAGNTATDRTQWCDYSASTDYSTTVVDTGVVREYWLELTDVIMAPDGFSRPVIAVNGSIPGPTLFADWGDTVTVHVTNSLATSLNGTSIHFHGIRQNYTNENDGVVAITQCPVAVGQSMTYTWKATQYGTSWYHSHIGLQTWMGVFGGIIINGPATANYDEDLGMLFLNDWDHRTVDELYPIAQTVGPPTLDTGLINGTNVFGSDGDSSQTGSRFNVSFTPGKSYRLRVLNAAIDTHFKFSIDNHTMTVIAADLVPIEPFTTTVLNIEIAQRYDIIVTADQASTADNFWMRAIPQTSCSDIASPDNIKGIVYYTESPGLPTTTGHNFTDSCDDETTKLVPYVKHPVSSADWTDLEQASVRQNSAGLFKWFLNSTSMLVDWAKPTLLQVLNGTTTFETDDAVIKFDKANQWVYLVIETAIPVPHPIHLHGHDFHVLAQGTGTYSASSVALSTTNPPRRDTAMLPASGYLVLAWETDNPGAWLMHCHIGWHTSEGFALQFIERQSEMEAITNSTRVNDVCAAWDTFGALKNIEQKDSGV
ncbi:laccase Lcc4 [Metarhizium rileyi]|uniref:laccase n=1 Tax=Metarhizium rileyi (strain RCEF 4871) TaxID=1649241 RepID=A0A166Y8E5_METRR|nr:laccase Lcc4 [Metarhizium rileyi RCEF 4871]